MTNEATAKAPEELAHAIRHLTEAQKEWESGHWHMAAMHVREAITDSTWTLYDLWAISDERARG